MTRLYFEVKDAPAEMDLAVEVRRPDMRLVQRTVRSEAVEVSAGTYFVTARLPGGGETSRRVTIGEGEASHTVELELERPPEPQRPRRRRGLGAAPAATRGPLPMRMPLPGNLESVARRPARLRLVAGNLLQRDYEVVADPPWERLGDTLLVPGREAPLFAQLFEEGRPAVNLALPTWPNGRCRLVFTEGEEGLEMACRLEHAQAQLLLDYRLQGRLREVEAALASPSLDAERLLFEKRREPIAAAVGAYALLRFGDLDRLHGWTENLRNWFPWLPDGAAVRGEHLARAGSHAEALAAFLELAGRGLPLFSDGVSYAIDRLGLYVQHGAESFDGDDLAAAERLLGRLQPFLAAVDFGRSVTTFHGLDPAVPDDEPVNDVRGLEHGVDPRELLEG